MHTMDFDNGINILHNGDFSGDVIIVDQREQRYHEVTIPVETILDFVAEIIRSKIITAVENTPTEDIFKVLEEDLIRRMA